MASLSQEPGGGLRGCCWVQTETASADASVLHDWPSEMGDNNIPAVLSRSAHDTPL